MPGEDSLKQPLGVVGFGSEDVTAELGLGSCARYVRHLLDRGWGGEARARVDHDLDTGEISLGRIPCVTARCWRTVECCQK